MIKLVLSDMDDTLLPVGQEHLSYRAIKAIHNLMEAGVRFGPATGRDAYELEPMFFGARDCYATGIIANGKRIYVDGELRRYALLEHEGLRRLSELLADVPNAFLTVCEFDNPRGTKPYWCLGGRSGDVAWFEDTIGFVGRSCEELPEGGLVAATIACAGSQEQLDAILARAREVAPGFDFVQPREHWCDILPAGLNKGSALALLLEELDIEPDEVVAFGDADNDLGIFAAVEHSVAVANATPAAREAARWHIGASADEAVIEALEDIAESARIGSTPRFMRP